MKIYFTASIKGRKKYFGNYKKIIETLQDLDHKVIENVCKHSSDDVYGLSDKEKIKFYKGVLNWINKADLVIAEVSYPSLRVGYELSLALEKGKPVIVLYINENASYFLKGVDSEKFLYFKYDIAGLKKIIQNAIGFAKDQMDVRFNFFISPKIGAYLDWVSKTKKTPRAVYLRRLIEEDMAKGDYESKEVKNKTKVKRKKR